MRILVVEDDKMLAEMYRDGFELAGYEVDMALSAQEALNKLDKQMSDAIVLDMILPGRSGIEVIHELNSYVDWQKMPVIMLHDVPRSKIKISDAHLEAKYGINKMVYKPATSPSQLVELVRKVVGEKV